MACPYETEWCKNHVHCQTCSHYKEPESITTDIYAEWIMALDDYEDGFGEHEYPHCSRCNRGVYRHDAGSWCPFCGKPMRNPMR